MNLTTISLLFHSLFPTMNSIMLFLQFKLFTSIGTYSLLKSTLQICYATCSWHILKLQIPFPREKLFSWCIKILTGPVMPFGNCLWNHVSGFPLQIYSHWPEDPGDRLECLSASLQLPIESQTMPIWFIESHLVCHFEFFLHGWSAFGSGVHA